MISENSCLFFKETQSKSPGVCKHLGVVGEFVTPNREWRARLVLAAAAGRCTVPRAMHSVLFETPPRAVDSSDEPPSDEPPSDEPRTTVKPSSTCIRNANTTAAAASSSWRTYNVDLYPLVRLISWLLIAAVTSSTILYAGEVVRYGTTAELTVSPTNTGSGVAGTQCGPHLLISTPAARHTTKMEEMRAVAALATSLVSHQLSATIAQEHVTGVISGLPPLSSTAHAIKIEEGIDPLVLDPLSTGAADAKGQPEITLTQLAPRADASDEIATTGAVSAFIRWLHVPSLGPPEVVNNPMTKSQTARHMPATCLDDRYAPHTPVPIAASCRSPLRVAGGYSSGLHLPPAPSRRQSCHRSRPSAWLFPLVEPESALYSASHALSRVLSAARASSLLAPLVM